MSSGLIGDVAVHPLESLVAALESDLAQGAGGLPWTLTPSQLVDLIPRLAAVSNQLDAVKLGMVREADRHHVGDPRGFANTAGWFATVTRTTKPAGHRAVALARSLDDDAHAPVRDAAATGAVSMEQVAVIVRAVEKLPAELVDPTLKQQAETDLVAFAAVHGPKELGFLGKRILEHIAPDIAEEAERRVLEAEERQAAEDAYFFMNPDGHGSYLGRFKIPVLAGSILEKHLNALAAPKHQAALAVPKPEERIPRPVKLGAAFVEYLQTRPITKSGMPKAGGIPALSVVTMTAETLAGTSEKAAELDNGERISAALARAIVCTGSPVMRMILGADSEPLDVGRAKRFHTSAQRIAIGVRDRTCREENCDATAAMSHVHHIDEWGKGGDTNVKRGILLCTPHHTRAHHHTYDMRFLPNGDVRFTRRT